MLHYLYYLYYIKKGYTVVVEGKLLVANWVTPDTEEEVVGIVDACEILILGVVVVKGIVLEVVLEVVKGDVLEVELEVVIGDIEVIEDTGVEDIFGVKEDGTVEEVRPDDCCVLIVDAEDVVFDGAAIITGAATTTGTVLEAFLVSCIILDASVLRVSICFWVVSNILDSTIASYNLTPFT